MDIGKIGVVFGLCAAVAAVVLYLISLRGSRKMLVAARFSFGLAAVSGLFCFGRLMWLVTHKQFQYNYVFSYVSPDLEYPFLAAATWAGQEGSFLLWTLWTGIIGCLVAWKAGKWEPRVMPIYATALCFLFGILVWLSPYNLLPRGGATGYPLDLPWPPTFGKGLSPSLQNYWMAIHPPTIFFGFTSLMVPFAYAIAALIWREYESWASRVMPWVLMTVATLGVGLMMGGYWAYETQGWHGFWGWDPVENASLFPWLGSLTLLHGLVMLKSRGGMARSTLFMAIFSWNLFLWGTFLTRSGALSGNSIHAFDMNDNGALKLILLMMGIYGVGGLLLLAIRWKSIPSKPISDKVLSRDTAMVVAVTLMVLACLVVMIGSSWPFISKWNLVKYIPLLPYSPKGIAPQPHFYNTASSVLIIPTLILMGVVPFLAWGKTNAEKFLWKVIVPWMCAIGVGVLVLWYVWSQAGHIVDVDGRSREIGTPATVVVSIATLGAFAALANIGLAWKLLRVKAVTMGGWLAHIGIGIFFLGAVISNVYEDSRGTWLIQGEKPWKTPFGYSFQFEGWTHADKEKMADEAADPKVAAAIRDEIDRKEWYSTEHGIRLKVIPNLSDTGVAHADSSDSADSVDRPGSFSVTLPVFHNHQLDMNQEADAMTTMRWPFIKRELGRDVYVLVASDPKFAMVHATLVPGETRPLTDEVRRTTYLVEYKKFEMVGSPGTPGTKMVAYMNLITPEGKVIPIHPGRQFTAAGGMEQIDYKIPEADGAVVIRGGIQPGTHQVEVAFSLPEARPVWAAPIQITNKPMINLVWLGVILVGLGTLCAMVRRSLEARKGAMVLAPAAAGVTDSPMPVQANGSGPTPVHHKSQRKPHAKAK